MTTSDSQLLQQFARNRSETVFATLVSRHVDLVYSAALRQVRSPQLAEDVAQTVFIDLSRNADKLAPDTILTAWLYRVTRRAAIDVVRSESRRQLREQIAVELATMNSSDTHWTQIAPLLDEAMDTLDEADRSSILLRYFENKSLREVGQTLGTSDDAAQKRVSRAVERLRKYFSKNGIVIGSGGFVMLLSANAVQAAPIGLSAILSSSAIAAGTASAAGLVSAGKALIMTTTQKILIATALTVTIGTGVYELAQNSRLKNDLHRMEQKLNPLAEQNEQLRRERDEMQKQLLSAQQDAEQWKKQIAELPKLRGEMARVRESERELAQLKAGGSGDSAQFEMTSWLARVDQLKKRLEERPDQRIPELQFLKHQDWLDAARGEFKTDKDIREALSRLRRNAESKFASVLDLGLKKYMEANQGKFPGEIAELQKYFEPPVDVSLLQRYEIVPPKISADGSIKQGNQGNITQKFPIDAEFDTRFTINPDGVSSSYPAWRNRTGENSHWEILSPAMKAYKAVYGVSTPSDYSLLRPYIKTPEEEVALEKVIQEIKEESEKK